METITMTAVGVVQNGVREKMDENWGSVCSRITLAPAFHGGLLGLGEFSHVIILTYLNQASYEAGRHLQRHPRGLANLPLVGIFAQRAKDRPNRMGVTAVKLLAVGDDWLEVQGLDAIDGTPVLDIKPYFPAYDRQEDALTPAWVDFILKDYF